MTASQPERLPRRLSDLRNGREAVDRALATLGLRRELLVEAIEAGVRERRTATSFEPTTSAGVRDWLGRVGRLRELLDADGWRAVDHQNASFSRSPNGQVLLGTVAGDVGTGDPGLAMTSERVKGPVTEELTQANEASQFSLFPIDLPHEDAAKVWLLVTYYVEDIVHRTAECRLEVSHPAPTKAGTHIAEWPRRYCLTPVRFDADPIFDEVPEGPEPDVRPRRR